MGEAELGNIVLVRSPKGLLENNQIGFGWPWVEFCEFRNAADLIQAMEGSEHKPGRHKNQIIRYFNISAGDIVVVPLPYCFALAEATNDKSFEIGMAYGENRIRVEYLKDECGKIIKTPRIELSQGLSARLRIRQTVASLEDYEEELRNIYQYIKEKKIPFGKRGAIDTEENLRRTNLAKSLLANIQDGKTWLKAGGEGLELIVKELLDSEGYITKTPAKNSEASGADVDIIAQSGARLNAESLIIQVKHHVGGTGDKGIQQLINTHYDGAKWLITSGTLNNEARFLADENGISMMDGEELVEWIIERARFLKPESLNKLGLSVVPQALEYFA